MEKSEITFGVEIECLVPQNWGENLRFSYGRPAAVPGHPMFQVKTDVSIKAKGLRNVQGVEFVSKVLKGNEGLQSLITFVEYLNEIETKMNSSCGLHIHCGVEPDNEPANRRLVRLFAQHERAFFASTGTKSREDGSYALPITESYKSLANRANVADMDATRAGRFRALNLSNLVTGRRPTVEFRLFAPTLNITKMIGHLYCCIGLVEKAYKATKPPAYQRTKPPESGVASVERLMRCLHWSPSKGGFGVLDATRIRKIKKEFRRLAEKYDKA